MDISPVLEVLDNLALMGKGANGITRLAFSKSDMEARKYIVSLIKNIGLDYREDSFGNIFALFGNGNAPKVAAGSHIDTVPDGGKYDGALGTVAALFAINEIKKSKIKLSHPLELIIFQAEESSRFGHATMGSKVVTGAADNFSEWEKAVDKDGITLPEAMRSAGFDFSEIGSCRRDKDEYKCFLELHIDQSKNLMRDEKAVGVVSGIYAPCRVKVTIRGETAHSGATAMRDRKDALVIASELVLAVRNISIAYGEKNAVATVSTMNVYPGAMNVIPGEAVMYIDMRGLQTKVIDEMFSIISSELSKIALRYKASGEIELLSHEKPVMLNNTARDTVEQSCRELNIDYGETVSGAGHDAMNMARITDSAMIFVRNESGISHHIAESAAKEDMEKACAVLHRSIINLAK